MKEVTIRLSLAENVKAFVNVVSRFDYEMDLQSCRHVVDAKSILGIFSRDLSKPVKLIIHSENCGDLLEAVKPFEV